MRSDFVRIYKSVHTWTGILSGLALFIAFYAGALTIFKEPLTRWATPPQEVRWVPLAQTQSLILQTLEAHPEVAKDFSIYLQDAEHVPARMGWQVRDPQADDHDDTQARHYVATLDAQGQVQVAASQPSQLASLIDVLHRVVGLPVDSDPNRWLMGGVAVLYALALVSGVVVLMPSLVKDFFALRIGKNLKRMWLDAHNVVGIVSLPFHLVMVLTAIVFAYHDGIYFVQDKLLHDGRWATAFQRPSTAPPHPVPGKNPALMLSPEDLLYTARQSAPGFEPSLLQYQQVTGARAVVRVWGKNPSAVSPRARGGFLAIDPYSGKILNTDFLPGAQNTANLFISSFFALHMAAFGGVAVQWLYFLLGLAGAWLFYSGNLLWVESRRKRQGRQSTSVPMQRLDTRLMAAVTVGVSLGCVSGVSLAMVGSKWLHVLLGDANPWLAGMYYTAFGGCIAWACWQGAGRAAVHLLWLASLLTLAIPLTTLLAWCIPASGLWAHHSIASLGVDITALVGAVVLGSMAKSTAQRVYTGASDSVWSTGRTWGPQGSTAPVPRQAQVVDAMGERTGKP